MVISSGVNGFGCKLFINRNLSLLCVLVYIQYVRTSLYVRPRHDAGPAVILLLSSPQLSSLGDVSNALRTKKGEQALRRRSDAFLLLVKSSRSSFVSRRDRCAARRGSIFSNAPLIVTASRGRPSTKVHGVYGADFSYAPP